MTEKTLTEDIIEYLENDNFILSKINKLDIERIIESHNRKKVK